LSLHIKIFEFSDMDRKIQQTSLLNRFKIWIIGLLHRIAQVHYHEYPVLDDNGELVGIEFITTRGNRVIRIKSNEEKTLE